MFNDMIIIYKESCFYQYSYKCHKQVWAGLKPVGIIILQGDT